LLMLDIIYYLHDFQIIQSFLISPLDFPRRCYL
jgi:hypothetical protein